MSKDFIEKKIIEDLSLIKKQLREIKEHMVDIDCLLTAEEKELVLGSLENEAKGELVPAKELAELNSNVFEVFLDIPAQVFLKQSDDIVRARIKETLNDLSHDPVPGGAKRLIESKERLFRLRSRYLRLLYKVNYEKRNLIIIVIEPLSRMDI